MRQKRRKILMSNKQKFYLIDGLINTLEAIMKVLDLESMTGYSAFLAALKTQRTTYYSNIDT